MNYSFDGYMKLYLDGTPDRTIFDGDWVRKRRKILKKPRKYVVNIHLMNRAGERAVTAVRVLIRANDRDLSAIIFKYADAMVKENKGVDIVLANSYAVVRT